MSGVLGRDDQPAREDAGRNHPSAPPFTAVLSKWLIISVLVAACSCFAVSWVAHAVVDDLVNLLAAWIMQIPIVVGAASVHWMGLVLAGCMNIRMMRAFQLCWGALVIFAFLLVYAGSHRLRADVGVFLSPDILGVVLSNLRQVLPDMVKGYGVDILLLGAISTGLALWCMGTAKVKRLSLIGVVLLPVALLVLPVSLAVTFAYAEEERGNQAGYQYLPTTSLGWSVARNALGRGGLSFQEATTLDLVEAKPLNAFVEAHPLRDRPPVFVIILESVPWDRFGFLGSGGKDVTPQIDVFSEDCVVFPRTYATANHSNYAQTSIHSSQYPMRSEALDSFEAIDYPTTLLSDVLGGYGYRTGFFSAQNEDWQGMKNFIFANSGFDRFFHSKSVTDVELVEAKLEDSVVVDGVLEFLASGDGVSPDFIYVNLQNTHFPYAPQEGADQVFEPCSVDGFEFNFFRYDQRFNEHVENRFDNALRNVDRQVGRLLDALKEAGIYDESLIAISSDHGEAFYGAGYPTHGTTLYDDQIRVATMFKLPGAKGRRVRDDIVSGVDLAPSVLEGLGLPNHPNFQGQQVLEAPREGPVFLLSHGVRPMSGLVSNGWKLVVPKQQRPILTRVGLQNDEAENLAQQFPDVVNEMKFKLDRYEGRQKSYYLGLSSRKRSSHYPPKH